MSIFKTLDQIIEVRDFGFNAITISFLAIAIISILQIRAAIKQNQKIRINKSGESWNLTLFAYLAAYFIAFIFYGVSRHSLALFLSGLPGFFYFPIMINIWKYKKNSKLDKISALVLFAIIPLIAGTNHKGAAILIMFAIGAVAMLLQAYKMIKGDNYNDVEPAFLFSFLISSIFWLIYSISTDDRIVIISSSLTSIFILFLLIFYHRWLRKKRSAF